MNQEGILFQFAFGELINSYMALFLAGRRLDTDYGYICRNRQGTDKYLYSATKKARGFYV